MPFGNSPERIPTGSAMISATQLSRPVYGVEAADLDLDGRVDVAAVTSWIPDSPVSGPLRVWRNLGGIVRHSFEVDYGLQQHRRWCLGSPR